MNRFLYAVLFMAIFVAVPALHAAAPSADDLRKAKPLSTNDCKLESDALALPEAK